MKLAAVRAIAALAKEPVPSVVNAAYNMANITFGKDYILPKPLDPRLLTTVAPAVALIVKRQLHRKQSPDQDLPVQTQSD